MHPPKALLLDDLAYTEWATRILLDAAAKLTPEERTHNLGLSHLTVVSTLHHILDSESFWTRYLRTGDLPKTQQAALGTIPLAELAASWPRTWNTLRTWLSSLPENALAEPLSSPPNPDPVAPLPRWQILRHSVNHATLHRGQVVGMLRMLGKQPPSVDLMTYYLQKQRSGDYAARKLEPR